MFRRGSQLILSPSDLSAFLGCRHRTGLDLAVADGVLAKPEWRDAMAVALAERGLAHEQRYVQWLRDQGLQVLDLSAGPEAPRRSDAEADALTRDAMRRGVPVIYQALLQHADLRGYADILRRVETPSTLGAWSYEAHDTKLARDTRGATMLQLVAYSELLASLQGVWPQQFHVIAPALTVDVPLAPDAMAPEVAMAPDSAPAGTGRTRARSAARGPSAGPPGNVGPAQGVLFPADEPPQPGVPFLITSYRVADYAAFYRQVRAQLLRTVQTGHQAIAETHYPEPVEQCEICRWWTKCNSRRRLDDHLSFIAGIARTHRTELVGQGVPTLAAAAQMTDPLPFKPARGSAESYARLRDQARVQHQQRVSHQPVHELLTVQPGMGLARLPLPCAGDIFLDLEGARFAREGGREYLFGVWTGGTYHAWWAHTDAEEQTAFEAVMDLIEASGAAHPGSHVYHFGHYEASTFKRLMGRHATRADELDRLLRGERLIDLHAVVRQALRAGVESYSIKQLEQFYDFTRDVPLGAAAAHLQAIELALESGAPDTIPPEAREAVRGYNRDDCRSTEALRDWLETLRAGLESAGTPVVRPEVKAPEPPTVVGELEARQDAARARLLDGLPAEAIETGHPQHPRWLLAHLVGWHRREDKAQYWERYRLNDLTDEELLDERHAISGLEFVERVRVVLHSTTKRPTGSVVDRYRYPAQDVEIRKGKLLMAGPTAWGEIETHDLSARTLDAFKGRKTADVHPRAVFQADVVPTDAMQKSLLRLCDAVSSAVAPGVADSAAGGGPSTCGMDLLWRRPPRLLAGTLDARPGESLVEQAVRVATHLDRTTLAVQGPPGAGKTFVGAQMIRALLREGKKIGVVAVSHKVIRNLLDAVQAQASAAGEQWRLGHRGGEDESAASSDAASSAGPVVRAFDQNPGALAALQSGEVQVLGGTAWLWAREEFAASVDVLFVDEAGQMSLANALAVSPAAGSLVLLGDPQQLEQPQKGSHPDGVDISALEHVLGGEATMPEGRGLFLPETWRLAPAVCAFTSELFYEGKLDSRAGLDRQRLTGIRVVVGSSDEPGADSAAGAPLATVAPLAFAGAGVWWLPVAHDGNQNWSAEEIDAVEALVDRLVAPGSHWVDATGQAHQLAAQDILVVAPYNAHVNRLSDRLSPRGVRVGTVDKFQGQEAPIVIYAMAASSPDDAPRGMEFLYSLNRLNVATSRAKCAAFVVASPRLLQPECRTPRQMRLANALCRLVEMSRHHL